MDIGSVPGEIGILLDYREVTGTPPGGIWALVGLSGREERWPEMGRAPLPPSPNRTRRGGQRPHPLSNSVWAGGGARHLLALLPSLH